MKEINVMGSPLVLKGGIVQLTDKQAAARRQCLKPYYDAEGKKIEGCYEVIAETAFKVGEKIYFTSSGNLTPEIDPAALQPGLAEENEQLKRRLEELTAYTQDLERKIEELEKAAEEKEKQKAK